LQFDSFGEAYVERLRANSATEQHFVSISALVKIVAFETAVAGSD
jgi:hypothetical protein